MGIRIGPVRLSSRGARVSIGPRIARIHVGAGRTGFSSGLGPVTISSSGRRRRRPARPAAAYRPAGDTSTRAQLAVAIIALACIVTLVALCAWA